MNKSVLIVICDFLLLSLLALARFDQPENPPEESSRETAQAQAEDDLLDSLKISLENEQKDREKLTQELEEKQREIERRTQKAKQLQAEKKAILNERNNLTEELQKKEQAIAEAKKTQEILSQREQELRKREQDLRESLAVIRERQQQLNHQLNQKEKALAKASEKIESLNEHIRSTEKDNIILETRLKSAQTRRERLEIELKKLKEEKALVQKQTEELAKGVHKLAANNKAISQEIQKNQQKSLNTIFSAYQKDAIMISATIITKALLGDIETVYKTRSIIFEDAGTYWTAFHASNLGISIDIMDKIRSIDLRLNLHGKTWNPSEIYYLQKNPHIVLAKIPAILMEESNLQNFTLPTDPFRFSETILITSNGERFGEVPFKIDISDSQFIRVEKRIFNRIFGEFYPQEGDLVFSKAGEFMGLLSENEKSLLIAPHMLKKSLPISQAFNPDKAQALQRFFK